MKRQGDIAFRVESAKGDARAADQLVRDYLPFIKSEAAKFAGHPLQEGRDDELGIAMFAFHEAVLAYDESRGAFIPLASRAIRNRLIDYARRERRFDSVDSLDEPLSQDQDDAERTRVDALADQRDEIGERELRAASREEIAEFTSQLAGFGVELADVAQNCPRQVRTLEACGRALAFARNTPELLERLVQSKKLPIAALASGSGVDRKALERHRRYLVALLLAFTNGYEDHSRPPVQDRGRGRRWHSMKYLIMEVQLSYAVGLDEEGRFVKMPNMGYEVGQTVEDAVVFDDPLDLETDARAVDGALPSSVDEHTSLLADAPASASPRRRAGRALRRRFAIFAAAASMFVFAVTGYAVWQTSVGTVRMRINPAMSMSVNRFDRVVDL